MKDPIRITQPLENDSQYGVLGFVDRIDSQIRSFEGDLTALVDSPGGDIFKASILSRSISEHKGKTTAEVYGLAASAASLLLADFDYVKADVDARFMFHSAHVQDKDYAQLTNEQKNEIVVFNEKAKRKLISKAKSKHIDNEALINEIFNNKEGKDYWYSAEEAKNIIGVVDEVTEVKREKGKPIIERIAASIDRAQIFYNDYKKTKMGLFSKNEKPPIVARTAELKDGRIIVFNSASETIVKGDSVALVGSNESLEGEHFLKDGTKATFSNENEVTNIEEDGIKDIDPETMDMIEELKAGYASLNERVTKLEGGSESATNEEAKAIENKIDNLENSFKGFVNALKDNKLMTNFSVPKFENKSETILSGLDSKTEQIISFKETINAAKQN